MGAQERISWGSQFDLEDSEWGQHFRPQVRKVQSCLCDSDDFESIYVEKRAFVEGCRLEMGVGQVVLNWESQTEELEALPDGQY